MQSSIPQIVRDTNQLRRLLRDWRRDGGTIALAPINGGPHDGHTGLLETAKRHARKVIVSVFDDVDMTQAALLGRTSCDLIFAPQSITGKTRVKVAPAGSGDKVSLDTKTTQIARLFGQVQPDIAVFGERDWFQLVTLRQMVKDLALPIRIVSAPTIREKDGLAVSSRNALLTPEDRVIAPTLHKVLTASAKLLALGNPIESVTAATYKFLSESNFSSVEYVMVLRAYDLAPISTFNPAKPARLAGAVQLGRVRLTDNVPIAG